jgi:hypothetical protein
VCVDGVCVGAERHVASRRVVETSAAVWGLGGRRRRVHDGAGEIPSCLVEERKWL